MYIAKCQKCGKHNTPSRDFCIECGEPLSSATLVKTAQTPSSSEKEKKKPKAPLWIMIILGLASCAILYSCFRPTPRQETKPYPTPTYLTLDGTDPDDPDAGIVVWEINLWDDYDTRAAVVGVGEHGQQVRLVKVEGNGVLIELPNGKKGWVSPTFLKEYKRKPNP